MLPRAGALSPRRPRDALHSQAGTSSRKRAFCVRSRCRSCRTMWRFQRAAGTPGSLGPAMAALSRLHRALPPPKEARPGRGGAPRGLRDVRGRAAAGKSPDCTNSGLWGENGTKMWGGTAPGSRPPGSHKNSHMSGVSYRCRGRERGARSEPPGRLPPRLLARSAGGASGACVP